MRQDLRQKLLRTLRGLPNNHALVSSPQIQLSNSTSFNSAAFRQHVAISRRNPRPSVARNLYAL
jgi:hypothetical protein